MVSLITEINESGFLSSEQSDLRWLTQIQFTPDDASIRLQTENQFHHTSGTGSELLLWKIRHDDNTQKVRSSSHFQPLTTFNYVLLLRFIVLLVCLAAKVMSWSLQAMWFVMLNDLHKGEDHLK